MCVEEENDVKWKEIVSLLTDWIKHGQIEEKESNNNNARLMDSCMRLKRYVFLNKDVHTDMYIDNVFDIGFTFKSCYAEVHKEDTKEFDLMTGVLIVVTEIFSCCRWIGIISIIRTTLLLILSGIIAEWRRRGTRSILCLIIIGGRCWVESWFSAIIGSWCRTYSWRLNKSNKVYPSWRNDDGHLLQIYC